MCLGTCLCPAWLDIAWLIIGALGLAYRSEQARNALASQISMFLSLGRAALLLVLLLLAARVAVVVEVLSGYATPTKLRGRQGTHTSEIAGPDALGRYDRPRCGSHLSGELWHVGVVDTKDEAPDTRYPCDVRVRLLTARSQKL